MYYTLINKKNLIMHYIYNIGVLTVNIELMWRGLETGERTSFHFVSFRAEPHRITVVMYF